MSPPSRSQTGELSLATILLYALPAGGVNLLFFMMVVMYMNFATDVLGVAAGVVGGIFLVGKLWDGVSNPLAGFLSDRTRVRLGRRKSWLLASILPICVFGLMPWSPPADLQGGALNAWIMIAVLGFYTAHTMFEVPHTALGAELSTNPRDRNRIFGARHLLGMAGLFGAFGLGAGALEDLDTARESAVGLVLATGAICAGSVLLSVAALPAERSEYSGRGARSPLSAVRDVWRNPHARVILFVYFVNMMGMGGLTVLFPYMTRYVLLRPDLLTETLMVYPVAMALATPLWVWLGGRFERRKVWLCAMAMSGVGFGMITFTGEGTIALMVVASIIAGTGVVCSSVLGTALKADVIDYDEFLTGERKEGSYFAAWDFSGKVAAGFMVGLVGLTLQWVGFVPRAEQTETTQWAIRLLMGGMPALGFSIGIVVFSRFRFTQAEHTRIREEIDARALAESA